MPPEPSTEPANDSRRAAGKIRAEQFPLRTLNKNLAVVEVEKDKITRFGIVLPDTHQAEEVVEQGRVVAVAEDCELGLKPDDLVFYSKFIPQDLELEVKTDDGETVRAKVFIIAERDIMAIVKQ